jgi:hypothetical protein
VAAHVGSRSGFILLIVSKKKLRKKYAGDVIYVEKISREPYLFHA